jgi:hypothetical protein
MRFRAYLPTVFLLAAVAVAGCGSTPDNVLACSQPSPCGIVIADSGNPADPPPTGYSTAQTCALQQLAKGEPVRIHYNDGCEGMCYGEVLLVRSDGSVIVQTYSQAFEGGVDLDGIQVELQPFSESKLCTLADAAFFTACLAAYDPACASSASWVKNCATPAPASCEP